MLAEIRDFFRQAGVMEVETQLCASAPTPDPTLASLRTRYLGPLYPGGKTLYLQTSPEFAMKRLLAAGSGPIYQICKAFRNGEAGRWHNPEFTILEWYRPGWDHHGLMGEVAALAQKILGADRPVEKHSYGDLFAQYLGLDPHAADSRELRACALEQGLAGVDALDLTAGDWLDLLLTQCIEPRLGREGLCFVYDYPATKAALARIRADSPPVAERFELYVQGIELANGFHELTDAQEQRRRFAQESDSRRRAGQEVPPLDEHFLAALEAGLPSCSGVALGVDRLLMLALGRQRIDEVIAFPLDRA